jgi:hypothetical protein
MKTVFEPPPGFLEPIALAIGLEDMDAMRQSVEHRALMALRSTARRALACEAEAGDLESGLEVIAERVATTSLDIGLMNPSATRQEAELH